LSCRWSRFKSTYCAFYKKEITPNIRYCPVFSKVPMLLCPVCHERTIVKYVGEKYYRCLDCGFYLKAEAGTIVDILDEREFRKVFQKFKPKRVEVKEVKKKELKLRYIPHRQLSCGCKSTKVVFPNGNYVFSLVFCNRHTKKKRIVEKRLMMTEKEESIIEDYNKGMKAREIRKKYRIGWTRLYRILREHKIKLRSKK